MLNTNNYNVVDLFCGIGGLSHGFHKEQFKVVAGIDSDSSCKYAYEKNNSSIFINKKIENISSKELKELYPEDSIKILIGCAPCQPFSNYTRAYEKDAKWNLIYQFGRLIKEVQPDIISMENVSQLTKQKVFSDFIDLLKEENYFIDYKIVNCLDYGIPQTRKRLVLLASKLGKISLIPRTHLPKNYTTVKKAFGKLEPLSDGEFSKKDRLHASRKLTPINKTRILNTPYGGSWEDWPEHLKLDCHKKDSGKTYKNVYGRMKWEEPAPTMTTLCTGLGNGRFGHPVQNRAISLREAALIQTFPKYYKIVDPKKPFSFSNYGRHIGNAVPVKLGRVIAKSIKKHLEVYNDKER